MSKKKITPNFRILKYIIVWASLIFIGCCKIGYNYLTISNQSGKDKYYKAYISENDEKINIGFDDYNELSVGENSELVINKIDSDILDKSPTEKKLVVIYYDPIGKVKSNQKAGDLINFEKSMVKKYSKEDLENQNWEIRFDEN